jgi:four helix bundle protein
METKRVDAAEFRKRPKQFALRVLRLGRSLSRGPAEGAMGRQLIRSGTSVGANDRAVTRARSDEDFVKKLSIVEEEADETAYWMGLLIEAEIVPTTKLIPLMAEASSP